jgi:hypothetical protein
MVTVPASPVKNAPGSYTILETYTLPDATIDSGVEYARAIPGSIQNSSRQIMARK